VSASGSGRPDAHGMPQPTSLPDARRSNWVDTLAPPATRPYLKLARLDRPIGYWLLLLPCWWAAGLAAMQVSTLAPAGTPVSALLPNPWHMALFSIGAVVMRGAGCTGNDIVDRDLDRQVARTRNRPLPAGEVTTQQAVVWLMALSLVGLAVLLQFNGFTIVLGASSLVIVAIYPFMKRVTGMPQAVLGLAFSWGALVGWSAVFGALALAPVLLYAAAVFWTIGYDTIYALQDIEDDAVVGIKSSARTFGGHTRLAIGLCYGLSVLLVLGSVMAVGGGLVALAGLALFATHLMMQVRALSRPDPSLALALFRSNRTAGLLLTAGLCLDPVVRIAL
jgi:4-hydroxybenzoate polyprenyltransferase